LSGDSTKVEDVGRVLNGRKINVAFTSPPYAEQREYDESSGFKPIPPDNYVAWFSPVASNVKDNLCADGSWFVNIKPCADGLDTSLYVFDLVAHHVRELGWHFATEFCWERVGVPKKVTRRFKNQFEPVYQFALGEWKMRPDSVRHPSDDVPIPGGPGVGSTTWSKTQGGNGQLFGSAKKRAGRRMGIVDAQGVQDAMAGKYIASGLAYPGNRLPTFSGSHDAVGHAAAFPVGLPQFFINAYSDAGDLIYEPFCGSGSTIVAAQRTGRIGAGIEISPAYCAVILQRMADAFPGIDIRKAD
jgi:site-specific DNA-methyltransferase (adenine-specific)